jgi:putative nucleotidyltransferase with HDIG domain
MLKTIPTQQVTIGMHIHELKGAWVDHPFWKTKFVITDRADLEKLKLSAIQEVIIDTAKGKDVEVKEIVIETGTLADAIAETLIINAADEQSAKQIKPISAQEEQAQALKIIKQSKRAVASMFQDARLGKAINTESIMPLVDEISNSITRNHGTLISLVRLKNKDDYTYMHSVAVCALMTALAKQLGMNETEVKQAGLAGLLHDVGKAGVEIGILNKPGALTDDEFKEVKLHPEKGHALLMQAGIDDQVTLDVCLHHHEKMDGSGYPNKLKAEQISLFAKMGAVCDVYDAITSNRPYKEGWEPGASLKRMAQWEGHFDPEIFKAFVKSVGIYPIGSVIMLKSGRLGVVIDQTHKTLLRPVVKVFFSTKANAHIPIQVLDLSKTDAQDEIVGHESAIKWGIHNVNQLWAEETR